MNLIKTTFFLLIIFVGGLAKAQNLDLTLQQMQDDFDELVAFYNDIAVHKQLNKIRLGIDYDQEFNALRSQITNQTTPCDFREILEQVTNLIQDLHSSSMDYDYLSNYGQYQTKLNFEHAEDVYDRVKLYEEACPGSGKKLILPLIFSEGSYLVSESFSYKNERVAAGSAIVKVNGQSIKELIDANKSKVWPIKVDAAGHKYQEYFYRIFNEPFELSFSQESNLRTIEFSPFDTVALDKKAERQISYYSQTEPRVHYFKSEKVLYLGLPMMDTNMSAQLIKQIDSLNKMGVDFDKIAIDLRGNPGGSDMTWRNLLSHLTNETISYTTNLKFNYNPTTIEKYGKKKPTKEKIELLNGAQFWTDKPVTLKIKPSKQSINFEGEIYVLQDEFIYSSAGNFSNVCLLSDKLISVGRRTDVVGGLQKEPLFYRLKNSGLIYRSEPVLDFANVSSIAEFAHNEVEVEIPLTIKEWQTRSSFKGDIYGKDYLLNHDPIFSYVLKQ